MTGRTFPISGFGNSAAGAIQFGTALSPDMYYVIDEVILRAEYQGNPGLGWWGFSLMSGGNPVTQPIMTYMDGLSRSFHLGLALPPGQDFSGIHSLGGAATLQKFEYTFVVHIESVCK